MARKIPAAHRWVLLLRNFGSVSQNPFPCNALDLSHVNAPIGSILGRDELFGKPVCLIPEPLALPALTVRRNSEHSQVLPVEDISFKAHLEIRQAEVIEIALRRKSLLVFVAESEACKGISDDHLGLRAHKLTRCSSVYQVGGK